MTAHTHTLRERTRELAAAAGITITRRPSGAFHLHGGGVDLLVRDLADAGLESSLRQLREAQRNERYGQRERGQGDHT
ncbi:hypothetical protein [Novilysobacter arseniciresistens]|uniref:hypothetical protein n=1 Tax=Novilysobacter arseniciresistens TaxID=1385522 RepID=UPI000ACEDE5C|nr:hypothetical protein [Lysobacter arseniciresistens]